MNHRRIRLMSLTLAAIGIAVLAGCNDDEPAADSSSSTTEQAPTTTDISTTSSPATSAPPETTTTPATVAPTTAATTTPPPTTQPNIAPGDWEAILDELSRRRVSLYAAPDLARIGEYCMPATECAAQLEAQLGDYIARGEHIEGQQPFTVVAVENVLQGDPSPAGTLVDVVFVVGPTALPPARIVDANGNVVDELSVTTTNTRGVFTLVEWNDPALPYRLVRAEDLGPAG